MALVFPHSNVPSGIVGKFFDDGLEYLACVRHGIFIEFYLFPECIINTKTIDMRTEYRGYIVDSLSLLKISKTQDFLLVNCFKGICQDLLYWNGIRYNGPEEKNYIRMLKSPRPSRRRYDQGISALIRSGKSLYDTAVNDYDRYAYILDENTIVRMMDIKQLQYRLEVISLVSNQPISTWIGSYFPVMDYTAVVSYINRDDKSKIVVYGGVGYCHVLDISRGEAEDMYHEFQTLTDTKSGRDGQVLHLFYDGATGFPVLCAKSHSSVKGLYIFNKKGLHGLDIEGEATLLNERYILMGSDVFEIVVYGDGELDLVLKATLSITGEIQHTCRDLAGTAYIGKNGVFRESLAFSTVGVLSNEKLEPVTAIFWVGTDHVLLSGHSKSIVVQVHTQQEVKTWHRLESTLFACEEFQICGSNLYTKTKEIELPFQGACMFAQSGSDIVVGCANKVAIISRDLEVQELYEEEFVYSVFCEGYISNSGIHFFETPEKNILSTSIASAEVINGELYCIWNNGELRCGPNQDKVDLMLEHVNFVQASGASVLIAGSNDTYLDLNGEYFSLEVGDYESILVSDKADICVTLSRGVAYLKSNAGFRLRKKKVGGFLDYNEVTVFNDKLMCHQQELRSPTNNVIVKLIAGNVINRIKMPRQTGECGYLLLSDTHFLVKNMSCGLCFSIYSLENPQKETYRDDNYSYRDSVRIETITGLNGDAMLYISYGTIYDSVREVYKLDRSGELHLRKKEVIPYDTDQSDDEDEIDFDELLNYELGLQPSDYPKFGDHWMVFERATEQAPYTWEVNLIPKSVESIELDTMDDARVIRGSYSNQLSCTRDESDPNIYYCAYHKEVYKVSVDGHQEVIARIKFSGIYGVPTKYTINHGLKVKFEPEFISSGDHLVTTISIIPPQMATKLEAVQKELVKDHEGLVVTSEIDGRVLLAATMDPTNVATFTKHGIDVDELKKDLWTLFK